MKLQEYIKPFIILAGIALGFGFTAWTFISFMVAYTSGKYQVLLSINKIGEANIEVVLLPVVLIWILAACYLYIKNMMRNKSQI